jgi:hypothetical protein
MHSEESPDTWSIKKIRLKINQCQELYMLATEEGNEKEEDLHRQAASALHLILLERKRQYVVTWSVVVSADDYEEAAHKAFVKMSTRMEKTEASVRLVASEEPSVPVNLYHGFARRTEM